MLSRLRTVWGRLMRPLVDLLLRLGVSPDAVTVTGTVAVVAIALWAFPSGHLLLGAILLGVAALMDTIDGAMARRSGRTGPWGAFLDSTLDRFADGAIFAGLVVWFTGRGDDRPTALLALACLVLGAIVPYARARAEGVGAQAAVGIAEVVRGAYPDPKRKDQRLVVVDLRPIRPLPHPVRLADMRANPKLAGFDLLRLPRLSVMPVSAAHWAAIMEMAKR